MSGIAGVVLSDGKPVQRDLLAQMARSLSFRGPDGQRIWSDGFAGLAHAAHLIKGDGTRAQGPENLGPGAWIAADVRLDAREELIAELQRAGQKADALCSDARLLLHAYDAWGEMCVHHIAGDFAFGVWDAPQKQLFCACDQFGIRPLYFSCVRSGLVFSNMLDCVRLHPEVSSTLNDAAICDFLLFGLNCEEDTTSFANIQRLARAHWLKWSSSGLEIQEYWRPPIDDEIRYQKKYEYVEHFHELFRKALTDRIRGDSAGVLLSGGIDSSSVIAGCKEIALTEQSPRIHAFTVVGTSAEDPDRIAAQTVANALKIPLHLLRAEEEGPFQHWSAETIHFPEPVEDPFAAAIVEQSRQIAEYTAVLLSGEGSDNLMNCEPIYHLRHAWTQGKRRQAALDAVEHVAARFRAPDGLRGPLRRFRSLSASRGAPQFPDWMNEDLAQRLKLKERWIDYHSSISWQVHPEHPGGYASLFFPQWRAMFERLDPAYMGAAIDVRYPFLDLRLVKYLLAIPALPWFFRKLLLRESMRDRLPERIRGRAKISARAVRRDGTWRRPHPFSVSSEMLCTELERYVKRDVLERTPLRPSLEADEMDVRPWCLNGWLQNLQKAKVAKAAAMV